MRKIGILLINLIIIAIVICSYQKSEKVISLNDKSLKYKKEVDYISIKIIYDKEKGSETEKYIQEAIEKMPSEIVKELNENKIQIEIGSDNKKSEGNKIYIKEGSNLTEETIEEILRYSKDYYQEKIKSEEFISIYEKYKGSYNEEELEKEEFFTLSMKDYLINPKELKDKNLEIYKYFRVLIK